MTVTNDIRYVGVNDHQIDLFEGQYKVENGMAYNSYVILDEKTAVMDTVDARFTHEWLDHIERALDGRAPDYLVIQHMEPDHSANLLKFAEIYPNAVIVSSSKAFTMMKNFYGKDFEERRTVVSEGSELCLGRHTLHFIGAPMVHWPEVLMTYDDRDRVLFSADGFGKFGSNDLPDDDWACEARRYYFGIVGKYGAQVQAVLKKAAGLEISAICPLHGPVLKENLPYYLDLYNVWSSYEVETDGAVICYTSVYGNTKKAAELLAEKMREKGCPKVALNDLARCDMAEAVEDAFRYGKLVLASTTYNADVFPFMRTFIEHLTERGYKNRTVAFIENGSWAPMAAKTMKGLFEGSKNLTFAEPTVTLRSGLSEENREQIETLANELCKEYIAVSPSAPSANDPKALFNIGYGLYVVTSNDGKKDNGLIVNTVSQVTNTPNHINDDNPNCGERLSAIFILIISLILIGMDFLSLYYSYQYIISSSKRYSFLVFERCIKYQSIMEIFFTLFALLAAVSAALMALGITIGYDLFFEKFLVTFINFNYYVFGLLLLASGIVGLLNFNKVCYDCIGKNPNTHEFKLSTLICLILIAIIGGVITFIFSSLNSFEYVCDSIKFSKDGNYFLGKVFWKYVLSRNNERQNNNHERNE